MLILFVAIVLLCAAVIVLAAGNEPKNWAVVGLAVVALIVAALGAAGVFK